MIVLHALLRGAAAGYCAHGYIEKVKLDSTLNCKLLRGLEF